MPWSAFATASGGFGVGWAAAVGRPRLRLRRLGRATTDVAAETTESAGDAVHVLAISGSVGADPLNHRLLESAARLAAPRADFEPGPELDSIPFFHPEAEPGGSVNDLRDRVAAADAILLATPEYNGSLPASLKNAIDWIAGPERGGPIRGKPVAVIGADPSEVGCDWAQADVRKVLEVAGARVISAGLSVELAADAFADGETLRDDESAEQLRTVIEELISEGLAPG